MMVRKKQPTYITENKPFPKALRELMNETNTTQPMLADSIGVTRQTISLYCTGQSTPDIDVLAKLADYYNVSFDYLLGKSNAKLRKHVDIHERTGLSDQAIWNLENWYEVAKIKDSNGAKIQTVENTKAPEEISKMIESENFRSLIGYIRSLKYIKDEENDVEFKNVEFGKAKVWALKNEIGINETREYILYLIQNIVRDIVNEISPYTPINEIRNATQADFDDY